MTGTPWWWEMKNQNRRTNAAVVEQIGKLAVAWRQALDAIDALQELGEGKCGPVCNGSPTWEEHRYDLKGWRYQLQIELKRLSEQVNDLRDDMRKGLAALQEALTDQPAKKPVRQLVTIREACEILGVSRWTVLPLVRMGKLKALRAGKRNVRFRRRDVERLVEYGWK